MEFCKDMYIFAEIHRNMIIELDFEKKEVTIKDDVNIGEFIEKMSEIKDWKDWKVKTRQSYTAPQIIEIHPNPYLWYVPIPSYPVLPTYEPYKITC